MTKWGYGECCGPEIWKNHFPMARGEHQSPINIITKDTEYDSDLAYHKLHFSINHENSKCQTLVFTGHSFKIETCPDSMIVTGVPGLTTDNFRLVQFHFHWGCTENDRGSEHEIDGKRWIAELHLVHYNETKYADCNEASKAPDGLLVLGVLIENGQENNELQHIMEHLENIHLSKSVDLHSNFCSLSLKKLLPDNTDRYYTYSGSLTTPPCAECVTWVVFEKPITMSAKQILQFLKVHDDDCGSSKNYRPVCPINGRKVKKSFI